MITISVILQVIGHEGKEAEDWLEEANFELLELFVQPTYIQDVIERLISVEVDYTYEDTEAQTLYFPSAIATMVVEARSG